MAEVTALRSNALPYPVYGAPYGVTFPILDADGDLVTGAASLDSEISKNGDTFADCTNEATEIATSSGMYYLLLTATELTTDAATIIVKTATAGAKTTPLALYPRKLVTLRSGTSQTGAAGSITLDSGASAVDDAYNGCLIVGTLDGNVEARIISDYNGSTKVATVVPDWVTTPDVDDTFVIYLPEGMQIPQGDLRAIAGAAVSTSTAQLGVNVVNLAGSAVDAAAGLINANVKQISTDATAADNAEAFFDGTGYAGTNNTIPTVTTLTNAPLDSSGVTTLLTRLTALRAGYLDNLSAGAVALESSLQGLITTIGASAAGVASAVWSAATRLLTAGTNIVLAKGVGVTGFNDLSAAQVNAEADTALSDVGVTTTVTGRIDVAVSTRLAASSYTAPLDAIGTRNAIGLASANLDTQLDALPTNAELATALAAADDAVLAAIAALNNLSAAQVTAAVPTATQNADALLKRDFSAVTGEASRSALNALRFLRNKWSIAGAVLSVKKEDDATDAWTGTVTQTAGNPVSEIDPA